MQHKKKSGADEEMDDMKGRVHGAISPSDLPDLYYTDVDNNLPLATPPLPEKKSKNQGLKPHPMLKQLGDGRAGALAAALMKNQSRGKR